jgi:hypothetical protein
MDEPLKAKFLSARKIPSIHTVNSLDHEGDSNEYEQGVQGPTDGWRKLIGGAVDTSNPKCWSRAVPGMWISR